jgi:hypothetical protein
MKNPNTLTKAQIMFVILLAFMIVSMILPSDFVQLPNGIRRFDRLFDSEALDIARYAYRGSLVGIIYAIVNHLNNKLYIGSTSDPFTRFYDHLRATGNKTHKSN